MLPRIAFIAVTLAAAAVFAQNRRERDREPLPPLANVAGERMAKLDGEIATLSVARTTTPDAQKPLLELRIDSRLFEQWLWNSGLSAKDIAPRIAVQLRTADAQKLIAALDGYAGGNPAMAANVQQAATELHKLTFDLPRDADTAALDAASAKVSRNAAVLLNQSLKPARPAPLGDRAAPSDTPAAAAPTTAQLRAQISRLAVSVRLRQQLETLLKTIEATPKESDALLPRLQDSLRVADALQANVGVDLTSREQLDLSLSMALAMLADPRTRDSGYKRLDGLRDYRQALSRTASLDPAYRDKFAATLRFAVANPESAAKVIKLLQDYSSLQSIPPAPATPPKQPAVRRAAEAQRTRVTDLVGGFAQQLQAIGSAGNSPDALASGIETIRSQLRTLDALEHLEDTIAQLNRFKPRPNGGIEKTLNAIIGKLEGNGSGAAIESIDQISHLARLATQLDSDESKPSAEVDAAWLGNQSGALNTAWRATVLAAAEQLARGEPLSKDAIDLLEQHITLRELIAQAKDFETAVAASGPCEKWVDWQLDAGQTRRLAEPLQNTLQAAARSVIENRSARETLRDFDRQRPLLDHVLRLAQHAKACEPLPDETAGVLSRLNTPLDRSPFSQLQRVSVYLQSLAPEAKASIEGVKDVLAAK